MKELETAKAAAESDLKMDDPPEEDAKKAIKAFQLPSGYPVEDLEIVNGR